jgi:hypothetical protein
MYGTLPLSGPGDGVFPPSVQHLKIRNVTAATAFTAGSVVMLDIQQSRTTSVIPGHSTSGLDDSIFNGAILPTAAGIAAGNPILVCEEAIAAGATGRASLMSTSIVAKVGVLAGDVGLGAPLTPSANTDIFLSTAGQAAAFAAQTLVVSSTTATSGSVGTCLVWLNGNWFK